VPQEPFLLAAERAREHRHGRGLPDARSKRPRAPPRARVRRAPGARLCDTPLGEGGARLSSGQKQLVAVRARSGGPAAVCSSTRRRRASTARPSATCRRRCRARRRDDRHRDRAPAVDHSRGGPHRRAESRPHRGAGRTTS
jgi:hypothetical protein